MTYPSINIQGNILSSEILDKIQNEDISHQTPISFCLDKNVRVRDEIGLAWSTIRGLWSTFSKRRDRIDIEDSGTSETRNFWMLPFLTTIGYDVEKANAEIIDGKTYAISHRAINLDDFPIHISGINDSLDKRRDNSGPRLSPHALIQEYINKTENHLYALVTNGRHLRLLRDATRLVRMEYLEFDLEKMMEEELFADFAILYRILHSTRMPKQKGEGEQAIIESYHQDSLMAGARIREKLSEAVEFAIKQMANGFLKHSENEHIRQAIKDGQLSPDTYYLHSLRLIYRVLFLLVIEDRGLVYPEKQDAITRKQRQIYQEYYSISRLRRLASRRLYVDGSKHDLWENLKAGFRLFEQQQAGQKLGLQALGSGIFSPDALGILSTSTIDNIHLLDMMQRLSYFRDENRKTWVKVNYSDLDVEEFGSVYEGLLEYQPVFSSDNAIPVFAFVKGNARSKSGSHYTPEELVRPLIKHSLDYIIDDCLKKPQERLKNIPANAPIKTLQEKALLGITVCDVACGSGHILLSAARRIATELAKVRTGEDQPTPSAMRYALRDTIRNCIYGVDKNPLAVELCKVALWLEAHNPREPLNFLDHRIKCGDSIVGLAHRSELENGIPDEAFKTLPGDNKEISAAFRNRNKQERKQTKQLNIHEEELALEVKTIIEKFHLFKNLPETTLAEVAKKEREYLQFQNSVERIRLKQLADAQVAQFFIPKTENYKAYLLTDAEYRGFLRNVNKGLGPLQSQKLAYAETLFSQHRFFHWFIEFPEVINEGGFDCILGNPPFLGDKKLKSTLGEHFMEVVKYFYSPIGAVDIVTYFFRRIFDIICKNGFLSLISTNTIAQGSSREGGLEVIIANGGQIIHAVRSIRWPGKAAVEVSLVTITKQVWDKLFFLDTRLVKTVTSFLDETLSTGKPLQLAENAEKSFIGSYVLGSGYLLKPNQALNLIKNNPLNKIVLFPFLNGEDLNNSPKQEPRRWVINFFGWPETRMSKDDWNKLDKSAKDEIEKDISNGKTILIAPPNYKGNVASDFPDCYEIVYNLVKPERQRWAKDKFGKEIIGKYAVRDPMPERWWIYGEKRPGLYNKIKNNSKVLAIALTSKTVAFSFLPNGIVYSHATVIIANEKSSVFAILQSSIHRQWVDNYSSRMKTDQRYTPSDCFENYPFPQSLSIKQDQLLENLGEAYHEFRQKLMLNLQLGLTKTYNAFHDKEVNIGIEISSLQSMDKKEIEKHYGSQVFNMWNHLQKTPNTCGVEEAISGIIILRELHVEMDNAVLDAYGWNDIQLRHDFYEVDYLPENDRIRFTIHPDARKEILKRLLELNHKIFEEEAYQGLHKEDVVRKFYEEKGKPIPEEVSRRFKKEKKKKVKKDVVEEVEVGYGDLFDQSLE